MRNLQILVVDDDDADALMIEEALDSGEMHTTVNRVADGREALDYLHRVEPYADAHRPDLILLDLNMPVMDGRAFCRAVQREPAAATIPIVVVSTDATSAAACAPCRPAASVAKPFSPSALLAAVEGVLASAPPHMAGARRPRPVG